MFLAMSTQWRVGISGPTGLDYSALPVVEARLGIRKKDSARCFEALQIIESEVLRVWSEQRKESAQ